MEFQKRLESESRRIWHANRPVLVADQVESDVQYTRELKLIKDGAWFGYDAGIDDVIAKLRSDEAGAAHVEYRNLHGTWAGSEFWANWIESQFKGEG